MLEIHLDADTVILLGKEWMSKDEYYDIYQHNPELIIEKFEENPGEFLEAFIEAIGGIGAFVKYIYWRDNG